MPLKGFARSGHLPTLGMAFLYFSVSTAAWVLVGALGVQLAEEFGLSASQKGILAALPILGGALVRIPMGILVDRIGPKRTGLLGQLFVMVPLAWGWMGAVSLSEVAALGLLLGVAGGSFAVALPLAGRWYPPHHQGLAMGIVGAGNVGTMAAAFLAPRLAEEAGWRAVFGYALLPVAATTFLFMLLARESPAQPEPKPLGQYLRPLRRPDTLWLSLLYAFTFGGFVGLASYLVIFFHDTYGLARVTAGSVAALCVFAGSFMRPVGGWLADRAGGLRVLAWVFIIASMGLGGVALRPSLLVATSLLVVAMAALGVGNGAVFQLAPLRFPREIGVVTGIIGAAGGLGGFVVPGLLGVLEDTSGDSRAGFFCLSLAGAYGLALLTLLRERWLSPAPHRFVTPRFRPSYGGGTAPVRSTIIR